MKNNIIVFRGNPIEEMNGCFELTRKIFYLNETGMDDIKDNSKIITENEVPPLLKEQIVKTINIPGINAMYGACDKLVWAVCKRLPQLAIGG